MSVSSSVSGLALSGLRRAVRVPDVPSVPEGRVLDLPGRGRTFVVDVPAPEPDAPVVVLLHALGCTAYLSWYPVLAALAERYRVVLFDQRWHGRGVRSPRFRLADCADDVAAVLDALGVERCVATGYSMGGAVAQLTWCRHPERTEGLVLCATARNFRGARRERLFFPLVAAATTPLSGYARGRAERLAALLPEVPSVDCSDPDWGRAEFRSTSAWSVPEVLTEIGRFNSAPWVTGVDVPTSVVVTNRDRTVPERRQRKLAAAIPGAEVFEVAGGHASLVLGAHRFQPALVDALGSVVRRSRGGWPSGPAG